MKTLEEIKNEVAIENGFENYDNLISDYGEKNPNWYDYGKKHPNNFDKYFDEIAKRYAKEVAPLFKEAVNVFNIYLPARFWHKCSNGA